MENLGYILAGWTISLSVIGLYAASLLRRGKTLTARVPVERRRWITTDD